ncbi:MAG: nucleotidyl transferase AbiEii/AbiGii toxin family protein [Vicinamibacterales bacterium]
MNPTYMATARLLTEIAPVVFESGIFALKGGTAINLFLRNVPRLSVDLDLVFTDHRTPRAEALAAINEALRAGRDRLAKRGFKVQAVSAADMGETRLLVQRNDLSVKIEVNTVIRGTVYPTQTRALTAEASDALMADLEIPLLSPEDIYGGKLVAAMDRQHPRDLFDVMELFAHGGITRESRRAFVVYLASRTSVWDGQEARHDDDDEDRNDADDDDEHDGHANERVSRTAPVIREPEPNAGRRYGVRLDEGSVPASRPRRWRFK